MSDNLTFPPADNERDDTADLIVAYQKAACSKDDPGRMARFLEYEEARFTIGSKPWMATPIDAKPGSPFFEPIVTDDPDIKLANRNECAPILDGEAARLIGSTSEPSVTPDKATTIVHRAAKKAKMVLDDILLQASWVRLLGQHAKNTVDYGTAHFLAGFENDFDDLRAAPVKVYACESPLCKWTMVQEGSEPQPGGGFRYSGDIAREMIEAEVGVSVSQPGDEEMFATLHECPECAGALVDRFALGEDGDRDAFGYALSTEKPLPKVFVQEYADIDVFPIGGGRVTHGFLPEVTIETIAPIDWLAQRYEAAAEIQPSSLSELEETARYHPSGLEMWGYSGRGLTNDQKRWAVYRITIRQPFKIFGDEKKSEPLGRLMISANKTVLYNGPLMFEYKDSEGNQQKVPRMRLFSFPNELQNNSMHGISVFSRLRSPQQALDAMFSQFQWDMAENGSPTLLLPKGANIEGQGDGYEVDEQNPSIPNRIIRFDAEAGEPVVAGGKVTHSDWQPFTDGIVEHMQRTTGQSQLDQGKSVSGAPSASAQMYIGQRLDETRKPKGQRWSEHLSSLFSYMLDCVVAVYREKRQFKSVNAFENRTVKDFTGADLMGQTNVKVSTKPAHDTEAFQRQNILELIPLGLVDLSTPRQRLRVAKKLGTVDELDPEPNQQITDAQNEFLAFTLDEPRVMPVAKKRTDNHPLHRQTHLEDLRSPAGEALTRFWNLHELATDGWYEKFQAIQAAKRRIKGGPLAGAAPKPTIMLDVATGGPDLQQAAMQSRAYTEDQILLSQFEGLPENIQEQITFLQIKMLEVYPGFLALKDPADIEDARGLTEWLSHCDAHQFYEQEALAAAMPPVPPTEGAAGASGPGPGAPAPAPGISA